MITLENLKFHEMIGMQTKIIKSKSENKLPLNPGGSYFPNEYLIDEPIKMILIILSLGNNFDLILLITRFLSESTFSFRKNFF